MSNRREERLLKIIRAAHGAYYGPTETRGVMEVLASRLEPFVVFRDELKQVGFIGEDGEMRDLTSLTVTDMHAGVMRTSNPHWSPLFRELTAGVCDE